MGGMADEDDRTLAEDEGLADGPPSIDMFGGAPAPTLSDDASAAYTVIARKYRPKTFDDLYGQEAMVRTLKNAFASGPGSPTPSCSPASAAWARPPPRVSWPGR